MTIIGGKMIYRIKQFFWALTAQITQEEQKFIKHYLSPQEIELFDKLKIYEQKHSVNVAKALQKDITYDNPKEMIRVGLLHDIGKIKYPIGPVRKSIMVLLDKFTKGKIAQYNQLKMVRCYYEHPQIGYEMLKERGGYSKEFLEIIQKHHEESDKWGITTESHKLLQKWDSQY